MSLRGDLKIDRLKRGDLLLRAKDHFKGGPKTVDETMDCITPENPFAKPVSQIPLENLSIKVGNKGKYLNGQ